VLLIKTVKGFGMGKAGEGKNTVHQTKKLTDEDIKAFRDRFNIPVPTAICPLPFYKPADDTPEMRYLHERRKALGGYLPHRRTKATRASRAVAGHLQGRDGAHGRRPRNFHHPGLCAFPDATAA
jgi:pyruvate dehydrogenase E1 component